MNKISVIPVDPFFTNIDGPEFRAFKVIKENEWVIVHVTVPYLDSGGKPEDCINWNERQQYHRQNGNSSRSGVLSGFLS